MAMVFSASILLAATALATYCCQPSLALEFDGSDNQRYHDGNGSRSSGSGIVIRPLDDVEGASVPRASEHEHPPQPPTGTDYSSNDIQLLIQNKNYSPNLVLSSSFPTLELHSLFTNWKLQHSKTYNTRQEHAHRKLIWLLNHEYIECHNNNNHGTGSSRSRSSSNNNIQGDGGIVQSGHVLAHNAFSDMTHLEFQQRFHLGKYSPGVVYRTSKTKSKMRSDGRMSDKREKSDILEATTSRIMSALLNVGEVVETKISDEEQENTVEEEVVVEAEDNEDEATVVNVPEYKNWVEEGAVTNVKNQLFCGACWAFSAVGAIEGARYIKTGNLTELSMQQLIDCDFTDFGCNGGLMDQAYQYDQDTNVGLCSLQDYPFAYHRHWFNGCLRYMPYCTPLRDSRVEKFVDVNKTEEDLRAAIATQPVSVAVSAGLRDWQFYSKGIFGKGCSEEIDHAVLAVGYGHYDPQTDPDSTSESVEGDYWLIKNSWGEHWGLNGYIQLARGTGNEAEGGSSCVLTYASRPILKVEE